MKKMNIYREYLHNNNLSNKKVMWTNLWLSQKNFKT